MIRVNIEIIPFGVGEPRRLASVIIVNDGTGTAKRGNYRYSIFKKRLRLWKAGELKNFPRASRDALELLKRVLNQEKL